MPEDAYEAVSGQTESFKQYWREMFGVDDSADTRFTKEESAALNELAPADHKIFLALDEDERAAYLLIDETDERNAYLAKKAEEIRNRNMETFGQQGEQIAEQSAKVLKSAWSSLLGFFTQLTYLAVIPIYMFYFLGSKRDLLEDFEQELGFLSPRVREDVVFLIREFVGILVAFFRGQLLIGLLMGVGYAIGFQVSGLKFGLALGLLFGLLNVVPYLGSIIGIVTTLIVLVMKVFDIVRVMTNGNFGTQVIANEMWQRTFTEFNLGLGSALAAVLFLGVVPAMALNVRRLQRGRV